MHPQFDMDVQSPQFWKRPFRVQASSDPDTATAQTIQIMCQHVRNGADDEAVRNAAQHAADHFTGLSGATVSGMSAERQAAAAWWWCKLFIKFVHHENILRQRLGEEGHLQGLISPEVLVRMDQPEGDCAIFTECVCAFLRVFGIPYELVTVAVNLNEPDIYSHVYCYAVMPDGSRLPLDASHGKFPGWQVPSSDVFRRQVWDANGNPVSDRGSRFDGLHNYAMRGFGQLDLSTVYPDVGQYGGWSTEPSVSSGGFDWGGFIANLTNKWTDIGSRVIAPTTTYQRDARGNIIFQSPAGASSSVLPSFTAGSTNTLLWVGGGIVAVMIAASMFRGRR